MDFDNEFYKQWKTKATTNNRLFIDPTDFSREKMDSQKIFSSTALDTQVESQAFSLRLSTESFVDETEESSGPNPKEKQMTETILISDSSSSEESIFSINNIRKSKLAYTNRIRSHRQNVPIIESSDDETPDNLDIQNVVTKPYDRVNELLKSFCREESKESEESKENRVVIKDSDSEIEENAVPQIIKNTVAESATLSERKKREILHWLSTNFNESRCGSSCSQESVIADSRRSGLSSGNSSLERLELNFETPNNRGKLLKPGSIEQLNGKNQNGLERQKTIDQYFKKCKKGQLNIAKNQTPGSEKSDSTLVNHVKNVSKRVILPELESYESRTPRSQKSDKTSTNKTSTKSKRGLIFETEATAFKTPNSQKSNNTPSSNINTRSKRVIIPELKSTDSKTPSSQKSNNTPLSNVNTRSRRVFIPDSKSTDINTPNSQKSNNTPSSNSNTRSKRIIIPESKSIDSKTPSSQKSNNTPLSNVNTRSRRAFIPDSISTDFNTPNSQKSTNTPSSNSNTKSKKLLIPESKFIDFKSPNSQKSNGTPSGNVNTRSRRLLVPESKSIDSKTPSSQKSNNTPSSNVNIKSRRVLTSESKSIESKTPSSQKSNNTPSSNINTKSRKVLIPESKSSDSKLPSTQSANKIISTNVNGKSRRVFMSELEFIDSRTPSSKTSDDEISTNINTKSKKVIIPESESIDSRTSSSEKLYRNPITNVEITSKKVIIPESESFTSNSTDQQDVFKKLTTDNAEPQRTLIIPELLDITDDVESLDKSLEMILKNKKNEHKIDSNMTNDTTINDCADILENLYGATWRNKASALICTTEPKKQTTKYIRDVQTEKKLNFRKPRFEINSDSELSDKEKNCIVQKNQTTSKISKIRHRLKDDFIKNDSSTDSSPDCSYYTATSNPAPINFNTAPVNTIKLNDNFKKLLSICDSDSEVEHDKWKNKINQRKLSFDSSTSDTSEFDPEDIIPPKTTTNLKVKKTVNFESIKPKVISQAQQQPAKKSFLASLSKDVPLNQADFKAMTYRVKYNALREELCNVLYKLFNEKVFDNQLPATMSIEWSTRLRGTAGKCYNKQSIKALGKTVRSSRLVLATKILDSPDRLRDTLIHEMCHAATWLVNNISDGHGCFWKAWAMKAVKVFPELPPISRCHNYEIKTKYTYKCVNCGYNFGRHSKSLDLSRKRCGYCHGKFELLINRVTKDGKVQKRNAVQRKEPTGFALYVKENYHLVKQNGAKIKHGDIMKILGQQFSAVKLTSKPEARLRNNEDESP